MTLRQDQQQPLTRRQLREMERAASEGRTVEEPQVPAVELPFAADPVPAPADLRPVLADDAALPTAPEPEAPAAPAEPVSEAPAAPAPQAPVVPLTRRQLRELQQAQSPIAEAPAAAAEPAPQPITEVPVSEAAAPAASAPVSEVISEAPLTTPPATLPAAPEVIDAAPETTNTGQVRAYQPPTGHWSLGANESFDDVITSGVEEAHLRSIDSTGSATGSMLVVPVVPSAADMTGPLNATGEILLTGSIDLPRGLGSTGQIEGRFDGSDIDRMLDQHDSDARSDSGVAPVAATRAISTHAPSAAPNIVPPKKTSHKVGAVVGSVIGGVAALGVAGLLVAGFVFHAF
jgi:hypothetical protein